MMGIALYLVWSKKMTVKIRLALSIFAAQMVLNVFWSVIFFGMGNFWLAFAEIVALWIFILLTIITFGKINKTAGWLLVPYILWVSFASYLNFTIASLN
jgi:tryptophan-rich sensory protein